MSALVKAFDKGSPVSKPMRKSREGVPSPSRCSGSFGQAAAAAARGSAISPRSPRRRGHGQKHKRVSRRATSSGRSVGPDAETRVTLRKQEVAVRDLAIRAEVHADPEIRKTARYFLMAKQPPKKLKRKPASPPPGAASESVVQPTATTPLFPEPPLSPQSRRRTGMIRMVSLNSCR